MDMIRIFALAIILIMICSNRGASHNSTVGDESTVSQKENSPEDKILYDGYIPQAEFPGGVEALYEYIKAEMKYPAEALRDSAQGRVTISFKISMTGKVGYARVVRGRHPALDAEALRIVKNMPKWKPAIKNGKPVGVEYILPIQFKLPSEETDK